MTLIRNYINQLEDADCEITLQKKDGSVFDLSAVSTKAYAVVRDGYGNIIAKFAKATSGSWQGMDTSLMHLGTFKFIIDSAKTIPLKEGDIYVELIARFPSALHADGYYDVAESFYLFSAQKLTAATLVLP